MAAKKKILFVTQSFGQFTNGPGTYTHYLWESFRNDPDIEFHVVALNSTIDDPNIHLVDSKVKSSTSLLQSKRIYKSVADKAIEVAQGMGPGVIVHCNVCIYSHLLKHSLTVFGQINDYDSAEILSKLSYTLKNFGWRRVLSLMARRKKEKFMVKRQNLTICNSDFTRERIIALYGIKNTDRVITIHKAVDLSEFQKPAGFTKKPNGKFNLLFVGSNWRRKGLNTILRSLPLVDDTIELTIVGPTKGEIQSILQPTVNNLGLKERVHFLEKVERNKLREYYWQADAFVMPSFDEAFGVVLLEAMAGETPVIASSVGGITEIVKDGAGLLVDPGNHNMLAEAINKLYLNSELRNELIAKGLEKVQLFTKDIMIEKLKKVYLDDRYS